MSARARLVESIPLDLSDLGGRERAGQTGEALLRLTRSAERTIDLTAMYWSLLGDPTDLPKLSDERLAALGAGEGRALHDALHDAAARGVKIRILQGPGFTSGAAQESAALQAAFPANVEIETIAMDAWYLGGIMHQKIWVFDGRHMYLGSANMDWLSLTQVKEMGVVVEDSPELAGDATTYFDAWWAFAAAKVDAVAAFDPAARIWRKVPAWSELVPEHERRPSPLDDARFATDYDREHPLEVEIDGQTAGVYLSGCPREVRGRGRTFDGDALVHTILDARRSVCLSVMDFASASLYARTGDADLAKHEDPALLDAPVWWPDLVDALLHAVLTRRVWARLLVSKWAHTSRLIEPCLRALQRAADAGRADSYQAGGVLEIKSFVIPGWDSTTGPGRRYPAYSRVNHAKYIVTDRRINVGTSNMTWDYFSNTAGSSFNTDHPRLVRELQAVFDRDWTSRYAAPLGPG